MAMICVKIPTDFSKVLSKIEVPGTKEPLDDIHITLLYLDKNVDFEILQKCNKALNEVTQNLEPFSITIKKVSTFPEGEDGIPIIIPIESKELKKLNMDLKKEFDKNDIEYSKKWKEFKPHITLSYSKDKMKDFKIPELSFTVSEIMLWGGDSGKQKMTTIFPLSIEAGFKHLGLLKSAQMFNCECYN